MRCPGFSGAPYPRRDESLGRSPYRNHLACGLRYGAVLRPFFSEPTALLEEVPASIGCLNLVAYHMAKRHLDLVPMKITQVVTPADLPAKVQQGDLIAEKLEGLGLAGQPQVTGSTQ